VIEEAVFWKYAPDADELRTGLERPCPCAGRTFFQECDRVGDVPSKFVRPCKVGPITPLRRGRIEPPPLCRSRKRQATEYRDVVGHARHYPGAIGSSNRPSCPLQSTSQQDFREFERAREAKWGGSANSPPRAPRCSASASGSRFPSTAMRSAPSPNRRRTAMIPTSVRGRTVLRSPIRTRSPYMTP
jgi:hypothetical protein